MNPIPDNRDTPDIFFTKNLTAVRLAADMNPIPDNIGIPRHWGGKNKDSTEELEIKFEAYNALYLYF